MPSVTTMSPAYAGSKTNGILLETMQLVEPRKFNPPPNHLLQTKIYNTVAQNALVQARPAIIHFGGFEVGKKHSVAFCLANVSTDVIRTHIIPPQTKYFNIKYTKGKKFVPGLTLDCEIEFFPDEWRYYYDCIRINAPGEENLLVPIHAYPVMVTDCFPEHVDFPSVPVGHSRTKSIPLKCEAPVDFEFELNIAQEHPAFSVEPMSGIVPSCGEIPIKVTFSPTEFLTAQMKLLLIISQFNTKPLLCTFTGTSTPGLLKELTLTTEQSMTETDNSYILDPRCLTPLDRARQKRKKKLKPSPPTVPQQPDIEYGGLKFPAQLNCPHAISQVLLQEEGRLRGKDLKQAISAKQQTGPSTRQMKETMFEQAVRQNVYEERQNQLRWQVKLGDNQMSMKAKQVVRNTRELAHYDYRFKRLGEPVPESEYLRTTTQRTFTRTVRKSTQLASEGVQFDTYTNDTWASRHAALRRFAQAARKIIIRKRALDKLHSLTRVVTDWRKKKYALKVSGDEAEKLDDEGKSDELFAESYSVSRDDISSPKFPSYSHPEVKDDMAPDALGDVPFTPTDVVVKRKVAYFNLKVPQHYKLLDYSSHNVHDSSSGYVPPTSVRPLRRGAEDEIITLPNPVSVPTQALLGDTCIEEGPEDGDIAVEDLHGLDITQGPSLSTLTPPDAIFKPIKYPALHIFNPAPGLQVFQTPMPYAEVDNDFHLCPVPRYGRKDSGSNPHSTTQNRYIDREDVIRGMMTWKKFPSQGLTSLGQNPSVTGVWVPRWDDPFGDDLLPGEVPELLDSLPEEDREAILDEEGDEWSSEIGLTPEMVRAQFSILDSPQEDKQSIELFPFGPKPPPTNIPESDTGPASREKREQELEYFLRQRCNRLGEKVQEKTDMINNLHRTKALILK